MNELESLITKIETKHLVFTAIFLISAFFLRKNKHRTKKVNRKSQTKNNDNIISIKLDIDTKSEINSLYNISFFFNLFLSGGLTFITYILLYIQKPKISFGIFENDSYLFIALGCGVLTYFFFSQRIKRHNKKLSLNIDSQKPEIVFKPSSLKISERIIRQKYVLAVNDPNQVRYLKINYDDIESLKGIIKKSGSYIKRFYRLSTTKNKSVDIIYDLLGSKKSQFIDLLTEYSDADIYDFEN